MPTTLNKRGGSSHKDSKPLVENENAESIRFQIPTPPTYSAFQSLLSILSLALMSGLSYYFYLQVQDQALWAKLPFMFTIFGGTLGALFELGLLLTGTPFLMMKNKFTTFIQMIRFTNIAPVVTTILFFVCSFAVEDTNLRTALLYLSGFATFAMGTAFYYGAGAALMPLVILGIQVAQIIIVLTSGLLGSAYHMVGLILIAQAVVQATAFIVGTATPLKSTGFHTISTVSGLLLFLAVQEALKVDSSFIADRAIHLSASPLLKWGFILTCLAGFLYTMKVSPVAYNTWRSRMSNLIWGLQYFLIISGKRFPNPFNLTELYKDNTPEPSRLKPYYQQHPEFLPEILNIPAVERIEGNVTAFGTLVKKAEKAFKIIALLDHFFPQANVNIPLKDKPRMKIWSDGSDIYPKIYTKKLFGQSLPVNHFKITPPPVIDAYKEGQLLAYLAEFGIANPLLRKAPNREGYLVLDFRFLEKYDTKADYESYGGLAYFKVNSKKKRLELVSVVAPHTMAELAPNPMDSTFRHAESMVLASMYYQIISGKHLACIHMTYNLLEVVLHNAFDSQGQFNHPIRTVMYLHLFSHELAEELTTEHLVQEGAVFTQVFATTHAGMINHLNDQYHSFEYADDEDFEYRTEIMQMENGELLPNACINWELEYSKIWKKYADDIVNIVYANDEGVQKDKYIQDMLRGLNQVFLNGLPKRYDELQTKSGLSRWISDTMHHLIVRHQVYGTTGINSAIDPRISSPQVPKDRGTPGVDEWRSLMGVALATACSRFTLLLGKDGEKFVYLLDGVDSRFKDKMATVFEELHDNLEDLDKKWTKDAADLEFNYNYFRAVPSDLRTGPGY
ncbi:MAG: hypothetical protein ACPG49_03350 [Chitinophagales bacterium]